MKILVFGAGSIGCAFGGFLAESGHEVVLYGRPSHLNPIQKEGLKIEGILGRHTVRNLEICVLAAQLRRHAGTFDLILFTVKSFDSRKACQEIKKNLMPKAPILSIQNGLGNIEILHEFFPASQVLAARAIFGVERTPGKVKITVWGGDVLVGETSKAKKTNRIREISSMFNKAGLKSQIVPDIRPHIWGKVIYNSALNPLAALLDVHYGALLERKHLRYFMEQIVCECYQVAKKNRVKLKPGSAKDYTKLLFRRLIPDTYDHHPSMLYDLKRGSQTEIDALNGAVSRLGKRFGIKTPVNQLITDLIKSQETSRGEK